MKDTVLAWVATVASDRGVSAAYAADGLVPGKGLSTASAMLQMASRGGRTPQRRHRQFPGLFPTRKRGLRPLTFSFGKKQDSTRLRYGLELGAGFQGWGSALTFPRASASLRNIGQSYWASSTGE